jgi:hypothetical protein
MSTELKLGPARDFERDWILDLWSEQFGLHGDGDPERTLVDDVHDLERPADEQDEDPKKYVSDWVAILFDDLRAGYDDYKDERELSGTTLMLTDHDGRRATATIHLE